MSKHTECGAVGKFDCTYDEYVWDVTMDTGDGEGHVESSVAWFCEVTLETECEGHPGLGDVSVYCDGSCTPEWRAAQHYDTRYLIARENSQGIFWVETYDTEEARDERLEGLRQAYAEWDTDVLS